METDMSATNKLQALEAALNERGVVDVKFFFAKDGSSPSKVRSDVACVLDAMLNNRTIQFNGVGDSRRTA